MAISKRERQPGRLFTLSNKDFFVGIGHLVVGHSHGIASSRDQGVRSPTTVIIRHLASRLKPVNAPLGD
jgi:hypothetical protein